MSLLALVEHLHLLFHLYVKVYNKPSVATGGSSGVQFGAFSSQNSAQSQVQNVKNKLGVNAVIESTGTGLYRVRVYGMTESAAQKLKSQATANGIDSFVFH